jgi:hypothetical protein
MRKMMMAVFGTAVLAMGAAQALTPVQHTVKVPFAFIVSGETMPSGTYVVTKQEDVVTLTNTQTRRKAMTMAGIRERNASQRNELVFRCAESQCALAEIWTSSSDYGSIRPSKAISAH